jgi:hypothetical protein
LFHCGKLDVSVEISEKEPGKMVATQKYFNGIPDKLSI